MQQVLGGIAQFAQLLEPELCVFFFVVGSLQEQSSDLLVALLLCLGCEVSILVAGLGLASKGNDLLFL